MMTGGTWNSSRWHPYPTSGSSLFFFGHHNPFRLLCHRIVTHPCMFVVWICAVIVNTALKAVYEPDHNISYTTSVLLLTLQAVLLAFFWIRCMIEIIALGFLLHPRAFLCSFWNVLELSLNVLGIFELLPMTRDQRWLRAFAVARSLRFFQRIPGFVPIILPFVRGGWILGGALLFFLATLASLALVAVMVIGDGLYKRCYITSAEPNGPYALVELPFPLRNVTTVCGVGFHCPSIAGATVECRAEGVPHGVTPLLSYNNMASAMLLLFKVATMDNWYEDVENIMNIHGGASALLLICVVLMSFLFSCLVFAIVHEFYTLTASSGVHEKIFTGMGDGDAFLPWRSKKKKDVTVQTSSNEPMLLLPSLREATNAQNASLPPSLCNSFAMVRNAIISRRRSCFVPYPGVPPQRSFLEAYRANGLVAALRDQERSLYGPICRRKLSRVIVTLLDSAEVCLFMIFISFANMLLLVLTWEGMDTEALGWLMIASAACSSYFILPVILKCLSFGPLAMLSDVWSVADALSAFTGILELTKPHLFCNSVVRGLRVLRLVRLGKYISLPRISKRCHISDFAYSVLLIAVTLTLYAIVGVQIFADSYQPRGALRGSFKNVWNALLICLFVFTGDHWTDCMRGALETGTPVRGMIFFVTLYLLSLLELNMLVSVMIGHFKCVMSCQARSNDVEVPPLMVLPPYDPTKCTPLDSMEITIGEKARQGFLDDACERRPWVELKLERWFSWFLSSRVLRVRGGASLFLFEPQYSARQLLLYIFGSMWYRLVVMLCIITGVVSLLFERRDNTSEVERRLWVIHLTYTVFFLCEMCLKWVAFGVIFPAAEHDLTVVRQRTVAYFRDPFCWIDFIVNVISFIGVYYAPCRVGRSIRAIRLLASSEYPNVEFIALLEQLKHVWSVVPLIGYLFLLFGVLGMQFFGGRLHYCSDRSVRERSACVGTYTASVPGYTVEQSLLQERRWVVEHFTYDNFYRALLSLFALSIGSNWTALMYAGMDAVDENTALSFNHSVYNVAFFLLAVVVIRFVALKTVIAIILSHLSLIYSRWGGFVTDRQQQQDHQERRRLKAKFIMDTISMDEVNTLKHSSISQMAHRILTAQNPRSAHTHFYYFVRAVIFVNCIFLAITTSPETQWQHTVVFSIDLVGIVVCGVEVMLRLVAYGPSQFCRSAWNVVDFIVLTLITLAAAVPAVSFMSVFRVVKLARGSFVERLLYSIFQWRKLSLYNAFAMCCILLLVYAFIGVPLFGNVKLYDVGLTGNRNFRTALHSILIMFQVGTTDGWEHLMLACAQHPEMSGCRRGDKGWEGCGSKAASVIFFTTYIALMLLIIQLFVALCAHLFTTQLQGQTTNDFLKFRSLWLEAVGPGKPLVELRQFVSLIPRIPSVLTGLRGNAQEDHVSIIRFLSGLQLPLDSKCRIRYNDIIYAFICKAFRLNLRRERCLYFSDVPLDFFTAAQAYAAAIIQRYWRQRRCAQETERLAMLDPVYDARRMQNLLTEFPNLEFLEPSHANRESGDVASEQPLRLHLVEQLPRGALAAPGSSLFMFDFLDSVCPRMQSPPFRFQTDNTKHSERD